MLREASATLPLTKLKEQKLKSRTCHPSWIKNDFIVGDYLEGCYAYVLCIAGDISPPQTFITFISIVLFQGQVYSMFKICHLILWTGVKV